VSADCYCCGTRRTPHFIGNHCVVCWWATRDESERCAVENCTAMLGAPRDRNGFCERCADELEALERDERAAEVGCE
jgi:hypothetical protein